MLQLEAKTKLADAARRAPSRASATLAFAVDRVRDRLEFVAHRVVGDRREMDDGVDAVEQLRREVADVAEMLRVQRALGQPARAGQIMGEEAGVKADQFGVREALRADGASRTGPT